MNCVRWNSIRHRQLKIHRLPNQGSVWASLLSWWLSFAELSKTQEESGTSFKTTWNWILRGIEVKNNISIRDQSTSEQFSFMKVLNFKKICEIYRSQSKTT